MDDRSPAAFAAGLFLFPGGGTRCGCFFTQEAQTATLMSRRFSYFIFHTSDLLYGSAFGICCDAGAVMIVGNYSDFVALAGVDGSISERCEVLTIGQDHVIVAGRVHECGRDGGDAGQVLVGEVAVIHFIDGQGLAEVIHIGHGRDDAGAVLRRQKARDGDGGDDAQNDNHHEQLDQRKSTLFVHNAFSFAWRFVVQPQGQTASGCFLRICAVTNLCIIPCAVVLPGKLHALEVGVIK